MESIRKHGLLQPLILRVSRSDFENGRYKLVCGHRRYAACRALSFERIPSIVKELSESRTLEIALIENLQRQDLEPVEEAEAFKLYVLNFGRGSITSLSQKIGKSQEYVSHRLLLLGLPKILLERISRHLLKPGEATETVWLKDQKKQIELADEIISRKLSFRETRLAVKMMRRVTSLSAKSAVQTITLDPSFEEATPPVSKEKEMDLEEELDTINRAILLLRSSLTGLDLLVDQTCCSELQSLLKHERTAVHSALDDLIKQKVIRKRNLHKCSN